MSPPLPTGRHGSAAAPVPGARPLIVLRTYGPVDFVFDMQDTEGDLLPEGGLQLPYPREGQRGRVGRADRERPPRPVPRAPPRRRRREHRLDPRGGAVPGEDRPQRLRGRPEPEPPPPDPARHPRRPTRSSWASAAAASGWSSTLTVGCQTARKRDPGSASNRDPLRASGFRAALIALEPQAQGAIRAASARVRLGQARFLKRQLSLPVSTISQ